MSEEVFVDSAALRTFAGIATGLGAQLTARGAVGRAEFATLAPVYGLIGAEFLAAAVAVTGRHADEIEAVGGALTRLGVGTTVADALYTAGDTAGGAGFTGATS